MIHERVELHNVAELHYEARRGGYRLQRVPGGGAEGAQPRRAALRPAAGQRRDPLRGHGPFAGDALLARPDPCQRLLRSAFDSYQRAVVGREPQTIEVTPSEAIDALPRPLHVRHAVLAARGAAGPGWPGARSGAAARRRRRGGPPAGGVRAAVTAPAHLRHLDHARLLRRGSAPDLRRPRGAPAGHRPDQPGGGRLRPLRAGDRRLHGRAHPTGTSPAWACR